MAYSGRPTNDEVNKKEDAALLDIEKPLWKRTNRGIESILTVMAPFCQSC
ncbi:MAG: hypothetical protein H7308_14255 [Chthonomonadaceae bacterium]|nr:hypothetical protein [Chthonomonadaceae bacterium]